MKKLTALIVMLTAGLWVYAQQGGRQQFDLFGGNGYNGTDSTLRFRDEGMALVVSGRASGVTPRGGGGYIIESKENLEFKDKSRLIVRVTGIGEDDRFEGRRMLKLELDKRPQQTITAEMKNRIDPDFINARNDTVAVFDISRLRNIKSINLVFFDCTVENLKIEVFYE
jgi:hypothetical protein